MFPLVKYPPTHLLPGQTYCMISMRTEIVRNLILLEIYMTMQLTKPNRLELIRLLCKLWKECSHYMVREYVRIQHLLQVLKSRFEIGLRGNLNPMLKVYKKTRV